MGSRRKRAPVRFDELYLYFALANRETSYIEYPHWTTVVQTECGIRLHRPPLHNGGYWCTPSNSVQFANTGGDGCHFSFLALGEAWSEEEDWPVVMTVPASFVHNVVVGENLTEFLQLGLYTGYFVLEGLAHSAEEFDQAHPFVVDSLEPRRTDPDLPADSVQALARLTERFHLAPWSGNIGARLKALQRQYLPRLEFGDEYHAMMGPKEPNG